QEEATRNIKDWDIAEGQYWQESYDPYDPFTLDESHAEIPSELLNNPNAVPILISPATIYPEGRMKSISLKGIDPNQTILKIPTRYLQGNSHDLLGIIGSRTAKTMKLQKDDFVTVRWRDKNGTFDATDIQIRHIFQTTVLAVDANQIWLPLDKLQEMLELPNEATKIVTKNLENTVDFAGWEFQNTEYLLKDLMALIDAKKGGGSILYVILLFLAMIAIFDTQILSVFRRRKEMGTLMALGMTRIRLIALFTFEGILHAILAIFVGAVYGAPLLNNFQKTGMSMGVSGDEFGMSGVSDRLYPVYGLRLVIVTVILVLIVVSVVSYLPTQRIGKLKPTDALKGKMTK
ncbi:MAG: FtsX-like permease family protein, partial [Candidatus Cloacimonetes bacterium]|nr:FtsX-like permease family protein [Candidatus Cloacimonadota bacterium]